MLEVLNRHSDSGVKAHWNNEDMGRMLMRPLPFSSQDVDLIRAGVAKAIALSKISVTNVSE